MTIEELLDCSPEKLEAMTDAELYAYFEPFLKVTRPELQERKPDKNMKSSNSKRVELNQKKAQARALLEQMGFKIKI